MDSITSKRVSMLASLVVSVLLVGSASNGLLITGVVYASPDEGPIALETDTGNNWNGGGGGGGYSDPYDVGGVLHQDIVVVGDPPLGDDDSWYDDDLNTTSCDNANWCGWGTGSSAGEAYPCEGRICQDITVEGDLTTLPEPEPNVDCQRQPTPDEVNRCIQECKESGYFNALACFLVLPEPPVFLACEGANALDYGACTQSCPTTPMPAVCPPEANDYEQQQLPQ
jgi:hypothetical protein